MVKAHGLRGDVVVELLSNRAERTEVGATLYASVPPCADGQLADLAPGASPAPEGASSTLTAGLRPMVVAAARPIPSPGVGVTSRWLVRFDGIGDRAAAEGLRDAILWGAPLTAEGVLWVHELVGCTVVDRVGRRLGVVQAVVANPASDLLELESGALVPLRFVTGCSAGRIDVDVPPGLVD